MSYLYLTFAVLAPFLSLVLAVFALIGVFEYAIEYKNCDRDLSEMLFAEGACFMALFVSATAFYYSLPVFVKEVL